MIKVIASDMDGTLLGDDHRIAPETLAAIRRACDAGIQRMSLFGPLVDMLVVNLSYKSFTG